MYLHKYQAFVVFGLILAAGLSSFTFTVFDFVAVFMAKYTVGRSALQLNKVYDANEPITLRWLGYGGHDGTVMVGGGTELLDVNNPKTWHTRKHQW